MIGYSIHTVIKWRKSVNREKVRESIRGSRDKKYNKKAEKGSLIRK